MDDDEEELLLAEELSADEVAARKLAAATAAGLVVELLEEEPEDAAAAARRIAKRDAAQYEAACAAEAKRREALRAKTTWCARMRPCGRRGAACGAAHAQSCQRESSALARCALAHAARAAPVAPRCSGTRRGASAGRAAPLRTARTSDGPVIPPLSAAAAPPPPPLRR